MAEGEAEDVFEWQQEHALFPTMVFRHKVRDSEHHNEAFKAKIYALREQDGLRPKWQSADRLHHLEEFQPLVHWVQFTLPNIAKFMGWRVEAFDITAMWANVLESGEYHEIHSHPNNFLSGVYYVQSKGEDEGKRINFIGPASADRVLVPHRQAGDKRFTGEYSFAANEGVLLIFPSWLWHYVKPNRSREARISISWNIMLRGEVGAHEKLNWSRY